MDPHAPFCPNPDCPARGQGGRGNLRGHCRKTRRSRGTTWDRTCVAPRGTPSSRRETAPETVPIVLTWLDHGCPRPAIGAAFGRDERTVARGQTRAGPHGQWVPEPLVQHGRVDRHHVPADERDVTRGGSGLAGAGAGRPVAAGAGRGHQPATGPGPDPGLGADGPLVGPPPGDPGLRGRAGQRRHGLRAGLPRPGAPGPAGSAAPAGGGRAQRPGDHAPRPAAWPQGHPPGGSRAGRGLGAVRRATGPGPGITPASLARLHAPFRSASAPLRRRGRALAPAAAPVQAGRFLVGRADTFSWAQESLRLAAPGDEGPPGRERTPRWWPVSGIIVGPCGNG
jgi:hypothetical protein